jgi:hypothetical protein
MSMDEAIRELALEDVSFYEKPTVMTQGQDSPPPKQWQQAASVLIARAVDCLWYSEEGKQALVYLRGRGLSDSVLKKMYIGYVPLQKDGRWYSDTFEGWGLDPMKLSPAQYAKGCVRVPNGILIPWFEGATIWKLAVKRPGEEMDYGQVLGSAEGLYNIGSIQYEKPAMLVEGEFDALSVMQEAGDLVACVATGSAVRGRSPRWTAELMQASFLIQSFDDDKGGHDGAVHWLNTYEKCFRYEPIGAKDPNDMLRAYDGNYVRDWVQAGLDTWECLQWPSSLPEPTPTLAGVEEPSEEIMAPHWQGLLVKVEQHAQDYESAPARVMTEEETAVALLYAKMTHDACLHVNREMQAEYAQEQFERLCISDRVETPQGPGRYWDPKQLYEHIQRGMVRVVLDSHPDTTKMFGSCQLEPVLEAAQLSLAF